MNQRLNYSEDDIRTKFFELSTPEDIAVLLSTDYRYLKYYLYILAEGDRYLTFEISKRLGGTRKISAPASALKLVQQKLNTVLQIVYQPKPSTHGFVQGLNIVDNAKKHLRKKFILNIDLKDFFDTINFGRVRGMFIAHPYNLPPPVATVLAQICCHENALPQGAPTSPTVSNMICSKLDSELQRLARIYNCIYTRYADDITFSTYLTKFPKSLAQIMQDASGFHLKIGKPLSQVIIDNGFEINYDKVRLLTPNLRQEVTGITTNKKPNIRRKYVRQIRAMIHAWKKFGLEASEREFVYKYDKKSRSPHKGSPSFSHVLKGKIEFLSMVRGKDDQIYLRFRHQLKELAPELFNVPVNELEKLLVAFQRLEKSPKAKTPTKSQKLTQRRGYELQNLLNSLFRHFDIPVSPSFQRNNSGEQIDGAFRLDGWHYIVECRWRKKLATIREVDGLKGQVDRSGKQTMGLFISINGWSNNVPALLKQNPDKSIILMNGEDLEFVLKEKITLHKLLLKKIEKFNIEAEPFYSGSDAIKNRIK